jgi:ATP-dependent DNA helicase RecG
MKLTSSITNVKGIGDKTAQTFEKLNIFTVEDVLFHFPRNYFRYPEAVTVEEITSLQETNLAIRAVIKKSPSSRNGYL